MKHLPFFGHSKSNTHRNQEPQSQSQLMRQTVHSVFPEANPWRAEFSQTFVCNNNQDNIPIETIIRNKNEQFNFVISQNRGSSKVMGQDCMSIAKHGKYEVITLSDGHDEEGHFVSQGVCGILPSILLRLIHAHEDHDKPGFEVDDDLMYDAFDECELVVCWKYGQALNGEYVRIAAGEYQDVAGYCSGFDTNNCPIVSVVEEYEAEEGGDIEVGYLEIVVAPEDILVPRFSGGGTCLTIIRNVETNTCRMAVAGDSRVLIYLPSEKDDSGVEDPCFIPTYGTKICPKTKRPYRAFLTPQHNVYNEDELNRLHADYSDAFVINGAFLVNPETNFMIQPTRGFGDHDMHGTGYTHIPQLSKSFTLPKDALIIAASDGVFDDNVWADREIVDRIGELFEKEEKTSNMIAKVMYEETLFRSEESGYVDDISLICYNVPELPSKTVKSVRTKDSLQKDVKIEYDRQLEKKVSMRSTTKATKKSSMNKAKDSKRQTLRRGDNLPVLIESILDVGPGASFDELSNSFASIQKKKSMNLEEKLSNKPMRMAERKQSNRKIVAKEELKAKVKKGGKTFNKEVKSNKKSRPKKSSALDQLLNPDAQLEL